jgi:hypothetical protein
MQGLFNMASDSNLFRTRVDLERKGFCIEGSSFASPDQRFVPLLEAKMVHHFDHRFGTYEGQTAAQENQGKLPELDDAAHFDPNRLTHPYYWVAEHQVAQRLADNWKHKWLLGWRDITGNEKQRTVIASLIPRTAVGHKFPLLFSEVAPALLACLYGSLCSFALDYAARQKIGGTSLTYFLVKQFPVLPPATYDRQCPWKTKGGEYLREWMLQRVLELTFTSWDLKPFAQDVGFNGPPFRWQSERRFQLRCELDAAFFHLYGLSREDTGYIMDTFPIVRKNDEKAYGEYRTKRVILATYDAMAEAIRTGQPYETPLDPPPADPRCCHPPKT